MENKVCTNFDQYMKKITHKDLIMTWEAKMTDGSTIWGDYERPKFDKCWNRFKKHCEENKVVPVSVKLYMFGQPQEIFFENPTGLDGLSITRGCSKQQSMNGDIVQNFSFLSVSLLNDDCKHIHVKRFIWPYTDLENKEEQRLVTRKNIEQMVFKHDSEKAKHPKVQQYLNGATM